MRKNTGTKSPCLIYLRVKVQTPGWHRLEGKSFTLGFSPTQSSSSHLCPTPLGRNLRTSWHMWKNFLAPPMFNLTDAEGNWNFWPGVQISPCRQAVQIPAVTGNAGQWLVRAGRAPTKAAWSPRRWRGWSDAVARGGGKSSPAAQLSQNNPPCTNNCTFQIRLLNKNPETLSSCSSQLSWEWQIHGSTFCQRCSDCAAMGHLPETQDRQDSPTPKNCNASSVWNTYKNTIDTQPRHDIPDRQGYLQMETTPSSFNNRKKYSDVDKSTHPVKFFFPLGLFFPPSLLLFSKLIHITCAFWFHYVRCY